MTLKPANKQLPAEVIDQNRTGIEQRPSEFGYVIGRLVGRVGVVALSSLVYSFSKRMADYRRPGNEPGRRKMRNRRRRMK